MSFSTPSRYTRPHQFLVERTDRNYAPYIPPSPTFSSDSETEPESLTDNQGSQADCGLDLGMSQVQSSCMEEQELPELVRFYMRHEYSTITDYSQHYSPTHSTSLGFNTATRSTPSHSQLGTLALAEVDIFSFLSLNGFLMIYFRMQSSGQTTASGNHTSSMQNL